MKPTLGRIVHYVNLYGNLAPAMIIGTEATTSSIGLMRWVLSPDCPQQVKDQVEYPTPMHVDLKVFGLGKDYYEYRVPYIEINHWDSLDFPKEQFRSWFWPRIER